MCEACSRCHCAAWTGKPTVACASVNLVKRPPLDLRTQIHQFVSAKHRTSIRCAAALGIPTAASAPAHLWPPAHGQRRLHRPLERARPDRRGPLARRQCVEESPQLLGELDARRGQNGVAADLPCHVVLALAVPTEVDRPFGQVRVEQEVDDPPGKVPATAKASMFSERYEACQAAGTEQRANSTNLWSTPASSRTLEFSTPAWSRRPRRCR